VTSFNVEFTYSGSREPRTQLIIQYIQQNRTGDSVTSNRENSIRYYPSR